jgi:predicted metal-binding protein
METEKIIKIVKEAGAWETGLMKADALDFSKAEEVRKMCEANTCRKYGATWACPPAVGTLDECRARCLAYENFLLFSGTFNLEDSFDFEGMTAAKDAFNKIIQRVDDALAKTSAAYLLLGNAGCGDCAACTYPDAPCRFPGRANGSVEGWGLMVSDTAKQAEIHYINGVNTLTYFAAVLF